MSFDDTDIPYVYEQDKKVERSMHRFNHPDEIIIDLHRVLYCSEESCFSSIINTVIFGKEDSLSLTPALNLSKKQKKSVFDVAKTNFLVDNVHLTEDEAHYILMQCRFETNDDLRSISRRNENEFRNTLPQMLGITKTTLGYMLRNDQKLKSFGFVDIDGDLDSSLNACIESQSIEPYFSDLLKNMDCSTEYDLDSSGIA